MAQNPTVLRRWDFLFPTLYLLCISASGIIDAPNEPSIPTHFLLQFSSTMRTFRRLSFLPLGYPVFENRINKRSCSCFPRFRIELPILQIGTRVSISSVRRFLSSQQCKRTFESSDSCVSSTYVHSFSAAAASERNIANVQEVLRSYSGASAQS